MKKRRVKKGSVRQPRPIDLATDESWRATSGWKLFRSLLTLLFVVMLMLLPVAGFIAGGWVGGMFFEDFGKKLGAVVCGVLGWIVCSRSIGHNAIETGVSAFMALMWSLAAIQCFDRK